MHSLEKCYVIFGETKKCLQYVSEEYTQKLTQVKKLKIEAKDHSVNMNHQITIHPEFVPLDVKIFCPPSVSLLSRYFHISLDELRVYFD